MKPTTTITTAAAALTAVAMPLNPPIPHHRIKVSLIAPFKVTNFKASTLVLSHREFYNFDVTLSPHLPTFHCHAIGTTLDESLTSIPETWCDNTTTTSDSDSDSSKRTTGRNTTTHTGRVSFQWTTQHDDDNNQDGGSLVIARRVNNVLTDEGAYLVPQDQIPRLGERQFEHQVYTGPENFSVDAWRYLTF